MSRTAGHCEAKRTFPRHNKARISVAIVLQGEDLNHVVVDGIKGAVDSLDGLDGGEV